MGTSATRSAEARHSEPCVTSAPCRPLSLQEPLARSRGNSEGEDAGSRGSDSRGHIPRGGGGGPAMAHSSEFPVASEFTRGGGEGAREEGVHSAVLTARPRAPARRSRVPRRPPGSREGRAGLGWSRWPRGRVPRPRPPPSPTHSGRPQDGRRWCSGAWGCVRGARLEGAACRGDRRFRSAEPPAPLPGRGRAPGRAPRGGPHPGAFLPKTRHLSHHETHAGRTPAEGRSAVLTTSQNGQGHRKRSCHSPEESEDT